MNFGCVVRPTAATDAAPSVDTIRVSIIPASVTKKLSSTAGHAMRMASIRKAFLSKAFSDIR